MLKGAARLIFLRFLWRRFHLGSLGAPRYAERRDVRGGERAARLRVQLRHMEVGRYGVRRAETVRGRSHLRAGRQVGPVDLGRLCVLGVRKILKSARATARPEDSPYLGASGRWRSPLHGKDES